MIFGVSLQLSIQVGVSIMMSKQGYSCKDILQWISVNNKYPCMDVHVFMDITFKLSFMQIHLNILGFIGYP